MPVPSPTWDLVPCWRSDQIGPISNMGPGPMLEMGPIWSDLQDGTRSDAEDSSCKEEKVEDFILKPEKLMEAKKLRAASPLSLSIFWAKKIILLGLAPNPRRIIDFFCPKDA